MTDAPLNAKDQADLDLLGSTNEPMRTLLEIWRNVLGNIEAERGGRVSPAAANQLVNIWPKLTFADVSVYTNAYYDYLLDLRDILDAEIAKDKKAFKHTAPRRPDGTLDPDGDAIKNGPRYRELLAAWQERIILWEHQWDSDAADAAARVAAIADATAFYVGPQGLVANLDDIGFQLTDDESEAIRTRLAAYKEEL